MLREIAWFILSRTDKPVSSMSSLGGTIYFMKRGLDRETGVCVCVCVCVCERGRGRERERDRDREKKGEYVVISSSSREHGPYGLTDYIIRKVITRNSSLLCLIPHGSRHRNRNIWRCCCCCCCCLQRWVIDKVNIHNSGCRSGSGSICSDRGGRRCFIDIFLHFNSFIPCLQIERYYTWLLFYSTNFVQYFHMTLTKKWMQIYQYRSKKDHSIKWMTS